MPHSALFATLNDDKVGAPYSPLFKVSFNRTSCQVIAGRSENFASRSSRQRSCISSNAAARQQRRKGFATQ